MEGLPRVLPGGEVVGDESDHLSPTSTPPPVLKTPRCRAVDSCETVTRVF